MRGNKTTHVANMRCLVLSHVCANRNNSNNKFACHLHKGTVILCAGNLNRDTMNKLYSLKKTYNVKELNIRNLHQLFLLNVGNACRALFKFCAEAFDKLIQGKHLDKAIKWIITYTIFNFTIITSERKGLSLVIIVKVDTDT